MKPETGAMLKHGIWGMVLGAIITIVIGFAWGGWATGGRTQRMSEEAVLATRAAICVAQFTKDPNYQVNLTEMKALNSWDRANYIEKGGWDRMPGEEKEAAGYAVSRACSDGLEFLMRD